jgi:hypothetical protein
MSNQIEPNDWSEDDHVAAQLADEALKRASATPAAQNLIKEDSRRERLMAVIDAVWSHGYKTAADANAGIRTPIAQYLSTTVDKLDAMIHSWWVADETASEDSLAAEVLRLQDLLNARLSISVPVPAVLQPGDRLVIGVSGHLSAKHAMAYEAMVNAQLPDVEAVVIHADQMMVYRATAKAEAGE